MPWLVFAVICFLIMETMGASAVFSRLVYGEWDFKGSDKIGQGLNLLAILSSLFLFWRAWRTERAISTGAILALATAFFLLLSALWSIEPETSLRRGVLYMIFVMGAIGVAGTLDGDAFMEAMAIGCFIPAVISLLLLVVYPSSVHMPDGTDLRGMFAHKNVLGQVMAAGALASLHGIRLGGRARMRGLVMLCVFLVAELLSRSATSLMVALGFCGVSVIVMLVRLGGMARMAGLALALGAALLGAVAAIAPDFLLELIGKDPTLTGRTELWTYVSFYISQRPVLGWGLTAFWSANNPIAEQISAALGWVVPQAHNGVLELLLEVGAVGTACFGALMIRNIVLACRCLRGPAREFAVSSLLCYGGIVLVGITEEVLIDFSQAAVMLFFVSGFICERSLRTAPRGAFAAMRAHGGKKAVLF